LVLDVTGTGFALVASMPGTAAPTVTNTLFNMSFPLRLEVRAAPRRATVNTLMTPPVEVAVLDAAGRPATASAALVTLSIDASAQGTGALSGTTTRAQTGGVARFDDLSIDVAASGYRLRASAPGASGVSTGPIDVTASALDAGLPSFAAAR